MPVNALDPLHLRRSFSRAASTYASANMIPQEIGQRLFERLDLMRIVPKQVVELGCATGLLSQRLAQRYPKARVLGIDFALPMLAQAQRRRSWFGRERFICADAQSLPFAEASVDLIFANLTPAWCSDLERLFKEIRRLLRPDGLFLFSSWGPDTLLELKNSWREVDAFAHAHDFYDMHDVGDALVNAKLLEPVMDMEKITVNYSGLRVLLNDLKVLGMQNLHTGRKKGLSTPRQFFCFEQAYEKYRHPDNTLPVTLEVIYGHAWAGETAQSSVNAAGEVIIPLSKIKRKSS